MAKKKTAQTASSEQSATVTGKDSGHAGLATTNDDKRTQPMVWFVIGLSITVATGAIIYINDDFRMALVKLTPLGSDPWKSVVPVSDQTSKSTQPISQQSQTTQQTDKEVHNTKKTQDSQNVQGRNNVQDQTVDSLNKQEKTKEASTHEKVESQNMQTNGESQSQAKQDTQTTQTEAPANVQDTNKNSQTMQSEESDNDKQGTVHDNNKENKNKTERKAYMKYNITNKSDYKIRYKLDAADGIHEKGDFPAALKQYDAILESSPESPRALWGKALTTDLMAEKQRSNKLLEEGMNIMDKVLRAPNTPRQLLIMIAEKLAARQQFRGWAGKAAATWKYLISKFPDNLNYKNKYGVCFLHMGKNDQAKTVFKEVLDIDPNDGFALVHYGFILKNTDLNYKDAIDYLQRGIDSEEPATKEGKFYYHLGDAYSRLNMTVKAREIYQRGADIGLFLSADQRSLYNADSALTGRPWWTPEQTNYKQHLDILEKNWKTIREEGLSQMDAKKGSFASEDENLSEKGEWKQFTLFERGRKVEKNCKKVPKTCAILEKIPDASGCKRGQVKYSVMHPGVHVWPHTGPTNCRIRAHLGLVVPEGPRIRVANTTGTWKEGKFIIFDDSFEHEVWHDGSEFRLVLIVDFWHPELTQAEKNRLTPI